MRKPRLLSTVGARADLRHRVDVSGNRVSGHGVSGHGVSRRVASAPREHAHNVSARGSIAADRGARQIAAGWALPFARTPDLGDARVRSEVTQGHRGSENGTRACAIHHGSEWHACLCSKLDPAYVATACRWELGLVRAVSLSPVPATLLLDADSTGAGKRHSVSGGNDLGKESACSTPPHPTQASLPGGPPRNTEETTPEALRSGTRSGCSDRDRR